MKAGVVSYASLSGLSGALESEAAVASYTSLSGAAGPGDTSPRALLGRMKQVLKYFLLELPGGPEARKTILRTHPDNFY